ncbi:MAG TPA: heavy metal-binding domain-containing protein [Bacteroidia bacterium]|nr:heavy metal-binding domain-containing protein [Bacteroidia bacterium]
MKSISNLVLAIIMIVGTMAVNAQNNTASDLSLKAQLMKMDGKLYLFITDEKDSPYSNKDITASVKLKDVNGKKQKVTLSPFGESAFVINDAVADFKQLVATLKFKSGTNTLIIYATFKNDGNAENRYACSMHPSELEKDAGKCTKCGMALSAKNVTTYQPSKVVRKGM